MTLQQAKEKAAETNGYISFYNAIDTLNAFGAESLMNSAMELYARSKWDEAIDASIKKFELAKTNAKHFVEIVQVDAVLAILDVTRKEFKP